MSLRKRNTAKPAWLQPQPLAASVERVMFQPEEDNSKLDLGIDHQACADATVNRILETADGRKKEFLKTLTPHERMQLDSKIMGYAFRIRDHAEALGITLTNEQVMEEAEALAARSVFLVRENGISIGMLKMNEVVKRRFTIHPPIPNEHD